MWTGSWVGVDGLVLDTLKDKILYFLETVYVWLCFVMKFGMAELQA